MANFSDIILSAVLSIISISNCLSHYSDRPRGVRLKDKPLYEKQTHFQCLRTSQTIPFEWVNDDFCDCADGSDEPGTSACPNGSFSCANIGHKPLDIPSSRVNDQICDCCDGSDEWMGYVKCANFCLEAGRAAREHAEKMLAIRKEGYDKKQLCIKQGKSLKAENQKKIDEQKTQNEALRRQLEELDMVKQVAEKSEKEAKDRHIDQWKAELEIKNKETQKIKAMAAFDELDVNKDKKITYEEVALRLQFDKNLDGKVAMEEYLEFFDGNPETELDHFVNEIWLKIQHVYKPVVPTGLGDGKVEEPRSEHAIPEKSKEEPPFDDKEDKIPGEDLDSEEEVKEDEVEDFDTKDGKRDSAVPPPPGIPEKSEESEEKMPDFDENTKKLIADADQARKEYEEVNKKIQSIDNELRNLEEFTQMDMGPDDEFSVVHRQCFEVTDSQYTYGLCMFDRTWQKAKDGYSEVNLGRWGSWEGPEDDKYSKQMYKNGDTCWNGPARSTQVTLVCGAENKLISASEPARCEYAMEFHTPLVCKEPPTSAAYEEHVEL